jgi:hypothetical protein
MVHRDQVQEMRPAQILIGSVGGLTRQTIWLVYPAFLQNDPMLCWLIFVQVLVQTFSFFLLWRSKRGTCPSWGWYWMMAMVYTGFGLDNYSKGLKSSLKLVDHVLSFCNMLLVQFVIMILSTDLFHRLPLVTVYWCHVGYASLVCDTTWFQLLPIECMSLYTCWVCELCWHINLGYNWTAGGLCNVAVLYEIEMGWKTSMLEPLMWCGACNLEDIST